MDHNFAAILTEAKSVIASVIIHDKFLPLNQVFETLRQVDILRQYGYEDVLVDFLQFLADKYPIEFGDRFGLINGMFFYAELNYGYFVY